MSRILQDRVSKRRLAACLLLWNTAEAQSSTTSTKGSEITSITTVEGTAITEIFTPTSVTVSGLTPPVTAGTTITTKNAAGETVAVAVAVGAGAVAGGALAAWLFKPIPGGPPAPTEPPQISTLQQGEEPETTSELSLTSSTSTTTTTEAAACPFPSSSNPIHFPQARTQPQWTAAIPPPSTVTAYAPKCTKQGDNNQLLRGTEPGYINDLAKVFCKWDLSKSQSATLGQSDLPDDSKWKNAKLNSIRVKFDFEHKQTFDTCPQNCVDAFSQVVLMCQYSSHVLFGNGDLEQGCGTYSLSIDADPVTKLDCNAKPFPIWQSYGYRDAALQAVNNFCTARDGAVLQANNQTSAIKELTFSAVYATGCQGSGSYTISKDTCVSYLSQTIDDCDTDSTMYKHGGTVTDQDNCGAFSYHPTGSDVFACYPQNKDAGYITGGTHVQISPEMAKDAIGQFCDRDGDGQTYTLDPNNIPKAGDFSGNSCTEKGMASCGYYYNDDGSRATGDGVGNIFVRLSAEFSNPGNTYTCGSNIEYAIHGDRCHKQLGKVIGIEPQGQCVGSDPSKLDLGTFLENADNGCVLWNMWAVKTS